MTDIGIYLKKRRAYLGITQHDLATRLSANGYKYADSSVAFWETGRGLPPLNDPGFMRALANALEVSTLSLLEEAGFFESGELLNGDLTTTERQLISAVRNGHIVEALQAFTKLSENK